MSRFRMIAFSLVVVGLLAAPGGVSHVSAQPAVTTGQASGSSGEPTWTRKKWNEMKAKWSQEKEKYAACRAKSKEQKLRGKKMWSFMYTCMTSSA